MAIKQSATLSGLGSTQFEDCGRAILGIHSKFASQLPPDTLLPWTLQRSEGNVCLEFSNRYFSPIAHSAPALEFDTAVDPQGILKNLEVAGKFTEDNRVVYYERVPKQMSKYVYLYQ